MDLAHRQSGYAVRCDWGPTGAAAIGVGASLAVVVDVLSFTTTLSVALARGVTVLPYPWRDGGAASYAAERDAVLAVGRLESRSIVDQGGAAVSLSPSVLAGLAVGAVDRVVLPSPNGSSICFGLRDGGATVIGASLRNRSAVARWIAPRVVAGQALAVVAAGERWPDGSLRPAVEDLWGAGAVVAALLELGVPPGDLSPEAALAVAAYDAVQGDLTTALQRCASGCELSAVDFGADVEIAAGLDQDDVVPVLSGDAFTPAPGASAASDAPRRDSP